MFVVSIFWSVMADVFSAAQGKRLFGFIGAGGTIGGITGAALTSSLVGLLGAANLLLVSAALLEVAALSARRLFAQPRLEPASHPAGHPLTASTAIGGSVWEGVRRSVSDPYLLNVTLNMLFFTLLTTFLYFQQATIVDAAHRRSHRADAVLRQHRPGRELVLTLATQTFATGRAVKRWGVTAALAFLPVMSVVGFGDPGPGADDRRADDLPGAAPRRQLRGGAAGPRGALHRGRRPPIVTRPRRSSTRWSTASAISSVPGPTRRWRQ